MTQEIDHFEHHHRLTMDESALSVTGGVGSQPIVNPSFVRRPRPNFSVEQFVEGIRAGDTAILSQAITLVESNNPAHYDRAQSIIEACLPLAGRSVRIGVTGVPGAGKSTFIEAIGSRVADRGHRLAVLAIDPSSERSGGSILGDKTRMERISTDPRVFIRPSPSAGSLGGVARKTRETVVLCEAAGFDVVLIETVGVGQSETAVHSMVDMFMMLQIAGAGDELQGIKRGIMEMADAVVVTKADGDNVLPTQLTRRQIENALSLFPTSESGWRARVYTSSAVTGAGLDEVWAGVEEYLTFVRTDGYWARNRLRQNEYWMLESINESLRAGFYNDPLVEARLPEFRAAVLADRMSSCGAAHEWLALY
jgi:LAO/AO transport system kinase